MSPVATKKTPVDTDVRGADHIGGWAGLAFTVVFAGFLVMVVQVPAMSDPAAKIHQWLAHNEVLNRNMSFLFWLALLFLLLPFAAALAGRLERTGAAQRVWARVMLAGVVVSIVMFSFDTFVGVALGLGGRLAELGPTDMGFQVVFDANKLFVIVGFQLAMGLWVAAASIGVLRSSIAPRWVGWLGLALLVPQLVAASWMIGGEVTALHDGLAAVGIIGSFLVWIPAVSVAMIRSAPVTDVAHAGS